MNSLKFVFVVIVLAVVAGAVYVTITKNPDSAPPPGIGQEWSHSPNIEVPDGPAPGFPFDSPEGGGATGLLGGGSGGLAPPFSPDEPPAAKLEELDARQRGALDSSDSASRSDLSGMPLPSESMSLSESAVDDARPNEVRKKVFNLLEAAREELEKGDPAEVLEKLSPLYQSPLLTAEENRQITELLDQVAFLVVYSREHFLERPYVVKSGDTLQRIARAYGVPWQLLAKINGVPDPENLRPGQELKVVRGPFDAVVNLDTYELTLMLRRSDGDTPQPLYAGRFRIGIGRDQHNLEGTHLVENKGEPAGAPNNWPRKYRIELSERISIHGADDPRDIGTRDGPGSICLGDRDIEDVHDILSIGSRVQIMR